MALMHYYPDEQVWLTAQCWGIKTGKCALRAFAVRITETQRFWGAYLRCRLMSALWTTDAHPPSCDGAFSSPLFVIRGPFEESKENLYYLKTVRALRHIASMNPYIWCFSLGAQGASCAHWKGGGVRFNLISASWEWWKMTTYGL